jgi:hypothetical protein
MGHGAWTSDTYTARAAANAAAGRSTFDYSDTVRSSMPRADWRPHELLDPRATNRNGPFAGKITREAADSAEHPNSLPIAVVFDVTGSMGHIPQILQRKLPDLHGLLQSRGYVEDPQILFAAVGDAYSDRVPLQVGQFESDNRMDEQLESIMLEGGGGGGNHESYNLAAYFLARHTHLDSVARRNKKGYLFFIGDERIYKTIDRRQVEELIGDRLAQNLSTEEIFQELHEKFEVFFLFADQGSYSPDDVLPEDAGDRGDSWSRRDGMSMGWRGLVGQNALILDDAEAVCETIALTIAVMEGTVNINDGMDDLTAVGANRQAVLTAGKAVAAVGAGGVERL